MTFGSSRLSSDCGGRDRNQMIRGAFYSPCVGRGSARDLFEECGEKFPGAAKLHNVELNRQCEQRSMRIYFLSSRVIENVNGNRRGGSNHSEKKTIIVAERTISEPGKLHIRNNRKFPFFRVPSKF